MKNLLFALVLTLSALHGVDALAQSIDFDAAKSVFSVKDLKPPYPPQGRGEPRWGQYLWEFGDGHYYLTDKGDPVKHEYSQTGVYTATLTVTPLYAKAQPMVLPPKTLTISKAGASSGRSYRVKDWVDLVINSPGEVVPEHTLRLIMHYKAAAKVENGHILLFFNKKGEVQGLQNPLTLLETNTRTYQNEKRVPVVNNQYFDNGSFKNPAALAEIKKLLGEFRDLRVYKVSNMNKAEQRRIFWDVNVSAALRNKRDKNIDMSVVALWVPDNGVFDAKKYKDQLDLRVSSVYDPNRLRVRPRRLYFKKGAKPNLRYILDFQNKGDGKVDDVTVQLPLGRQHDMNTFQMEKTTPYCPPCLANVDNKDSVCWEKKVDGHNIYLTFRNLGLEGTGSLGFFESKKSTKGKAIFTINAKDQRFPYTISKALITFQGTNEAVVTDPTELRWRQRSFYLKPGLQFGLNRSLEADDKRALGDLFSIAAGYQNSPVGAGLGWGLELGMVRHRFFRDTTFNFVADGSLLSFYQTQKFDIRYLDLKAVGMFNFFHWLRANGGFGVAMPAWAEMEASITETSNKTTLPDAVSRKKYGLFQQKEDVFLYNKPLENRPTIGLSAHVGAEIGLLQDIALGLSYEWRYFPWFYAQKCESFSSFNASLRFRIWPVKGR